MAYDDIINAAGQKYGIDPDLLRAQMMQESKGNPKAISPKGASGLMQLMPGTAKELGVDNIFDPQQNIMGGAKYMRQLIDKYGDLDSAVQAYNMGPGAFDKFKAGNGSIPKETSDYLNLVSSNFSKLKQGVTPQPMENKGALDAWLGQEKPSQEGKATTLDAWLGGNQPIPQGQKTSAPSPAHEQPGFGSELGRQIGLTGRAAVTGVTSLPNMVGDAANSLINMGVRGVNRLAGTSIPELAMPSAVTQQAMNAVGVPQPQNATERVVQNVASTMAGTAPNVGLGNLLAQSANPIAKAIGQGTAALPGMQVTSGAGSALGSALAQEAGLGPVGQILGGLAGGIGGAVAPSAALVGARNAANAGQSLGQSVKNVVQPVTAPEKYVGSNLAKQLGTAEAQRLASAIKSAPEFVPGSSPTLAQVGATPYLVATEKAAANAYPELKISLAERNVANNQARWNQLMGIAKSPEELEAAKTLRSDIAEPLYQAAHQETANVGKKFVEFARRPAVTKAMQEADELARNEGVQLTWPTPNDRAISGQALDYTSRALSNMIDKAQRAGASQEVRALTQAKDYLENWTLRYIPGVKQAKAAYAENSVPVNTMEAAQQIANKLGTGTMGAGGVAELQLNPYRTALVSALKGQKYGIDPQGLAGLQGIGQDLQRATISNSLKSPGSDTAYNLAANGWLARQLYGPEFEGAGLVPRGVGALGAFLTGNPMVAGAVLAGGKKAGEKVGERLNEQLANMLLNPKQLLPYLEAQAKQPNKAPAESLVQALRRQLGAGAVGTASGTSRP